MNSKMLAKMIAAMLNASRSAYVASTKLAGAGGIRQALLQSILSSRMFAPSGYARMSQSLGKSISPDTLATLAKAMRGIK